MDTTVQIFNAGYTLNWLVPLNDPIQGFLIVTVVIMSLVILISIIQLLPKSEKKEKLMKKEIEYAAEHLPENWQLSLCMEYGSAYVELHDHATYIDSELYCSVDDTLEEQIRKAVNYAKGIEEEYRLSTNASRLLQSNFTNVC